MIKDNEYILNNKYIIISVIGSHAGESEKKIFERKILDIQRIGKTFWLIRSHQAKPQMVHGLIKDAQSKDKEVYAIFIEPSSPGGATPTKTSDSANYYSKDRIDWRKLPDGLSPVTGKIDNGAYALVFDKLNFEEDYLDLWNYTCFFKQDQPIRILQGASTLCAIKKSTANKENKIKSHIRKIVAVGKICEPGCVWLK